MCYKNDIRNIKRNSDKNIELEFLKQRDKCKTKKQLEAFFLITIWVKNPSNRKLFNVYCNFLAANNPFGIFGSKNIPYNEQRRELFSFRCKQLRTRFFN